MRTIIQRVKEGEVIANKKTISRIRKGLLVFLAVHKNDTEKDINKIAHKILNLKIFEKNKKLGLSIREIQGEILLIPQFTLYGNCRKGTKPNFSDSASPKKGKEYYKNLVKKLKKEGLGIKTGKFQSHMEVNLINEVQVTL